MKGAKSAAGFIPYLLGSIMMIVLLSTLVPGQRVQTLSYTEFKHKVQANEVADVFINDVRIRGTFRKDDQPFDAIRIDDLSLVAELERHGVNVRGELATEWWSILGIWLLPLLFIVFWTQSLRGAAGPRALATIRQHRAALDAVVRLLLDREIVEGGQVRQLVEAGPARPAAWAPEEDGEITLAVANISR
jgi:ATP-dependent Zn protease